jgi:Alginate export
MRKRSPLILLIIAVLSVRAAAQPTVERFNRQLEQIQRDTDARALSQVPADRRANIDYGGFLSFDYFSIDDANLDNHILRQYQLVGFARFNLDAAQEIYFRGRMQYNDYNPGDSFNDFETGYFGQVDRAFYKFDSAGWQRAHGKSVSDGGFTFEGGRDLVYWGNGLALSQVIDGIFPRLTWNQTSLDLLAAVTPEHTVDIDPSRPHFDDNTHRAFYGGMISQQLGQQRPFFYALGQTDNNTDDVSTTGGVITNYDYNSYYLGIGSSGALSDRLLYGVELVYEGGDNLSNSFTVAGPTLVQTPQTRNDIQALAFDGRIDYLLLDRRKTRFTVELIAASGDDDRIQTSTTFAGNKQGSSDRAFNAFGLLNTGLAFAPAVSNLLALRIGAVTFPLPDHSAFQNLQAGVDFFVFNKLAERAPIDEPTFDKAYLGLEPDFFFNWQVTSDVTFSLRYGIFFAGDAIVNDEKNRQFFGAGVTYAF